MICRLPNDFFPEIQHVPVYIQNRGGLCGFHSYFNSKCMIRAILAKTPREKLQHLVDSHSSTKYEP